MQTLKLEKNRGFLVAAIGAIAALFAFLYLPFVSISSTTQNTSTFSLNTTEAANYQGAIWLEGLLAIALLVLALMLIYRHNPFGSARTPIASQLRTGNFLIGGGGILSIIVQFFVSLSIGTVVQQRYAGGPTSIGTGYDFGSWLYLLGMIAVIVGAVMAYRKMGLLVISPASPYQSPDPVLYSPYQMPPSSPYQMPSSPYESPESPYGGQPAPLPPYQQMPPAPSSPYDNPSGAPPPWYQQNAQAPSPYQMPNAQEPQQQWPPNYPS